MARNNESDHMKRIDREYDVLVVGAGVAGVHAAFAAARKKAEVLLVTSSWDTAAGLGWGPRFGDTRKLGIEPLEVRPTSPPAAAVRRSLIFEGALGENRVTLVDCHDFQGFWRYHLEKSPAINIFQDTCERLSVVSGGWVSETGWGVALKAKAVVLAVGTFLGGRVACGNDTTRGGRPGEAGAEDLESSLSALGIELRERLRRAGPTFDARSIRWKHLGAESAAPEGGRPKQLFLADANHGERVYLEPINKNCDQYYLQVGNGEQRGWEKMGTGFYRRIAGLENAQVTKPAFSVTSMSVPRELVSATTFNYTGIERLFFAGRIIGAGSYAQSAQEGLKAGMAAAAVSRGT